MFFYPILLNQVIASDGFISGLYFMPIIFSTYARARLLDIHDFFERFSKLGVENGIYYWVYKAVHVAEPSGKYESSNTR